MKRTADGWIATSMRTLDPLPVFRPSNIDDAIAALSGDAAPVPVAGGTDLVAQFNSGLAPHGLLALRDIDALRRIVVSDGHLHIGACVTHDAGSRSDIVRSVAPGFASAWGRIANVRVRMTATIGGNIMAQRTRYEMPILLDALGAKLEFQGKLLVRVSIPLDGLVAFDYDRTLRPVMTQAVCLRRTTDGMLALRATAGTEATQPHGFPVPLESATPNHLAEASAQLSAEAYATFPDAFADCYTSNAYLRRAGRVILQRQLERIGHAAA
jgi:carbon-monoxide dehydrogenase medium subunit